MSDRDRLREEYFALLPEIRRVAWQLETEIRFHTLPILHRLKHHEQLVIKARVKECESAIETLIRKDERKREGRVLDPDRPQEYSLLSLPDLAGVRVLVFPGSKRIEVDAALRACGSFSGWEADPVKDGSGNELAKKYHGFCSGASPRVEGEYQIVPMLIGYFWEVEHSAMYKPAQSLIDVANSKEMQMLRASVEHALSLFDSKFEEFVERNTSPISEKS